MGNETLAILIHQLLPRSSQPLPCHASHFQLEMVRMEAEKLEWQWFGKL
jgi:hypothetical protein